MLRKNKFVLYLIRHGESAVNIQPDLMGQAADTPLTGYGQEQAELLRLRFKNIIKFTHVYASDYKRAADTALRMCDYAQIDPIFVSELREYSAGDWEHGSRSKLLTPEIKMKMASLNNTFQPPHGEALNQVERRASKWLEDNILYSEKIIELSESMTPEIALVSHGMTIKCLLHYVLGFDRGMTWKIDIDNTSVTKLSFNLTSEIGWRVHYINDTSHLLQG